MMAESKVKGWFKKQLGILKNEFTCEPPAKIVKNTFYIVIGAFLVALGEAFFLLPMNIIAGGVSSISLILYQIPGFNVISLDVYVLIVTWSFFVLGVILLGANYGIHTLFYTICYPLFVLLFTYIIQIAVVDGVHILDITEICKDIQLSDGVISATENKEALTILAYFVSAIVGGLLSGAGIGFTLSGGGSSGGTDVINLLVNKYFHIKVGISSFVVDCILIVSGFAVNGYNLLPTLIGLITAMLCSIMIDKVFLGNSQYYLAMIVSKKWNDMNDFINEELGRGTTLIKAQGGYTKNDTVVLEVCFDRQDYNIIREGISKFDPNAFVMVVQAKEILGYGFSRNTPKSDKKDVTISADEARKLVNKARTKKRNTFKD